MRHFSPTFSIFGEFFLTVTNFTADNNWGIGKGGQLPLIMSPLFHDVTD